MPPLTDRQQQLLGWLQTEHAVSIEEIQSRFGVSAPTAYRDARALVQTGLALKTNGGVKLAPPTSPARQNGKCDFCGGTVNERGAFVVQLRDGSQRSACCPHCGLMALGQYEVLAALASDFLYGRMINARQAVFLLGSTVDPCCKPSVLCFASRGDAQRFQKGFGGQICSLEEAIVQLKELMALPATK